jgi:ArsR family transcriptional regulator
MKDDKDLTYMANIYMALADRTRLRLLDLMRDGEIRVGSFTSALGESQPKISRHLAYLRNVGIVETRREGKWMHYSIRWPDDPGASGLLEAVLEWLSDGEEQLPSSLRTQARPRTRSKHRTVAGSESEMIYGEPHMINPHIAEREYEAHNELDDFLL